MKKLLKILVIIIAVIIIVYVGYAEFNVLSTERVYSNLDKTCEVNSDCQIESASFCGFHCVPSNEDVYNKDTVVKIRRWRGNPYMERRCPVVKCARYPINYIPKCVNKLCVIEKSINCGYISYTKKSLCEVTDVSTINIIERELNIPFSEVKRTCNCSP